MTLKIVLVPVGTPVPEEVASAVLPPGARRVRAVVHWHIDRDDGSFYGGTTDVELDVPEPEQ